HRQRCTGATRAHSSSSTDTALPRRPTCRRRRDHDGPHGARNRGVADAGQSRLSQPRRARSVRRTSGGDSQQMTDPFDALRITDSPLDPRPEFADELRRTIAANLETDMTHTDTPVTTQTAATQTVTAYISVRNAAAAIAFYVEAFEAVELSRLVGDDGRIVHAEIMIGSSKLMLADEYPEIDSVGPETRGGPTCSFTIEVPDADAAFERAVAAGAVVERPVADQFHGNRMGWVRDPFGHRWTLSTPIAHFDHDEYAKVSKEEGYELIEGHQL